MLGRFIALCKLVRDQAEERTVSKQSENVFKELSLLEFQVALLALHFASWSR